MIESKMQRNGGIQTSVIISLEFYELCKRHNIKFSEALRTGVAIILAERGVRDYDNNLNITRLVNEYKIKAAQYAEKAAKLENGN